MSSGAKKIVCRASWRDPIYARFLQVSFSTVSDVCGPGQIPSGVDPTTISFPTTSCVLPQLWGTSAK